MCGIAGVICGGDQGRQALLKMLETLASRGPDNQGIYSHERAHIGHRRLKVIDLSPQADQPLANEDSTKLLVANGEIYNFRQLRPQLERLGHRFSSHSDSEVILHAYEEWGKDCLGKLRGMFAFCIFDKLTGALFLARDRFGIKPLYYYFKGDVFIFASQVKAILSSGLVSRIISGQGLSSYLDYGAFRDPFTVIEGVCAFLPGHYATLENGQLNISRYWDILSASPAFTGSYDEAAETTAGLLKESVCLHSASDVPLGLFLSGGIDSSGLTSIMSDVSGSKLRTVSLVFDEKDLDESGFSRLISSQFKTQHREVRLSEDDFLSSLPAALSSMDQPTFDGINSFFVSRAAKEAGLTVLLSGLGADELFCGYKSFRHVPGLERLTALMRLMPGFLKSGIAEVAAGLCIGRPGRDKAIEMLRSGSRESPYFWVRRLFTEGQKYTLLKKSIPATAESLQQLSHLDPVNRVSYLELTNYMRDVLLRDTDFMSMAHSLEVRVPYLDHVLAQFVLSVPGRLKLSGRRPKPLLLDSLPQKLPRKIYLRRKMGFVLPVGRWMKEDISKEIEEELSCPSEAIKEFVASEGQIAVWRRFLDGGLSWQRPWALYVLNKWVKLNNL